MEIAVTTSFGYWGGVTPDDVLQPGAGAMVGGGETAMFHLTRALARAGHQVTLFYDSRRFATYDGVRVLPKHLRTPLLQSQDWDLLISWEDVQALDVNHRAGRVIYAVQCNTMFMGPRTSGVDAYQGVSRWHRSQLRSTDPTNIPDSEFLLLPNGVDLARYAGPAPERIPRRVIHSSSPDRGLHHLLRLWPRIKKRWPEASLDIYYDMEKWFEVADRYAAIDHPMATGERAAAVRRGLADCEGLDVRAHGGLSQWALAREQMAASAMIYPCDPIAPTEGYSISILEALAAGTPVITTGADALEELWGGCTSQAPLPWGPESEDFVMERLGALFSSAEEWRHQSERGLLRAWKFPWEAIEARYVQAVEGIVNGLEPGPLSWPEFVEALP